ncbi:MAG: hypothetical protein HN350_10040 [Phycisphaerales bacterium]|nr:hypothetical protein [Phycisphaerales bacterium]
MNGRLSHPAAKAITSDKQSKNTMRLIIGSLSENYIQAKQRQRFFTTEGTDGTEITDNGNDNGNGNGNGNGFLPRKSRKTRKLTATATATTTTTAFYHGNHGKHGN